MLKPQSLPNFNRKVLEMTIIKASLWHPPLNQKVESNKNQKKKQHFFPVEESWWWQVIDHAYEAHFQIRSAYPMKLEVFIFLTFRRRSYYRSAYYVLIGLTSRLGVSETQSSPSKKWRSITGYMKCYFTFVSKKNWNKIPKHILTLEVLN